MATSTLAQIISNPNTFSSLISGVTAALVALLGQYYFFQRNVSEEGYRKLYGPITYNLLLMKILTSNREKLTEEILASSFGGDYKNQALSNNVGILIKQWIKSKERIEKLLEEYPGYVKKSDLELVKDFLDGCIKREIIENGKNEHTNEDRMDKILSAVKALQERFLK